MSRQYSDKERAEILDQLFGTPVQPNKADPADVPEPEEVRPLEEETEPAEVVPEEAEVAPEEAADPAEEGDTLEFDTPVPAEPIPEEDDVKVFEMPDSDAEHRTKVIPAAETIAGAAPLTDEAEETPEDNPEQISFDDLDENASAPEITEPLTAPDHDPKLKEEFRKNRESKVRSFRLTRSQDKEEESEENAAEDAPETLDEVEPDDEYVDDFTKYEDADMIAAELRERRSRGWFSLLATAVWEFLMLLNVLGFTLRIYESPMAYVISSAVLLLIAAACNFPLLRDGFEDLRDNRYSGDTAVLFSVAIALIHTLAQFAQLSAVSGARRGRAAARRDRAAAVGVPHLLKLRLFERPGRAPLGGHPH